MKSATIVWSIVELPIFGNSCRQPHCSEQVADCERLVLEKQSRDQLRLTIEARREKARELVDSGMSQRQAAKMLGVAESTIRNDLRNDCAESAQELRTEDTEQLNAPRHVYRMVHLRR